MGEETLWAALRALRRDRRWLFRCAGQCRVWSSFRRAIHAIHLERLLLGMRRSMRPTRTSINSQDRQLHNPYRR